MFLKFNFRFSIFVHKIGNPTKKKHEQTRRHLKLFTHLICLVAKQGVIMIVFSAKFFKAFAD